MRHLPFPLRVAAGLAVTTVERARELPRQLTELPVTVVSQTLHASMRVQQHVTELAIKGDTALSALHRPDDEPEWATFDEDLDTPEGSGTTATGGPPRENGTTDDDPWSLEERALAEDHSEGEFDSPATDGDAATGGEPTTGEASAPPRAGGGPAGMADYDELTLPQVRARLRTLTLAQLEELLAYERAHADRPSFTGMLARRAANVRQTADPTTDDPTTDDPAAP
ncbi:lipid droplet-associated protein [Saccharomonospora iraqiensis]|uniref:lipid droplet-associated protein n=1 Tax=Saccharomonospora iraqiensis TaxID=52698 RepID=UPI00047C393F|nr:lipid droplet-associated protein [Saccharomonospora iraqiensis]